MKNNIYILSLLIISTFFIGCDENEIDAVIDESAKPIVSITSQTTSIGEDGSPVFTFTINLDRPIKSTTGFSATQIGGTASADDFSVASATIPAYATSVDMEVSIFDDIAVEGTESVELEILPNTVTDSYEVLGAPTVSFDIVNSTSSDFLIRLEWEGDYVDSDGDLHHFCDYDLDLEFYNANFDLLDGSYSACPEQVVVADGSLADGDYWIVPEFWSNGSAVPPAEVTSIPASFTLGFPGVNLSSVDLSSLFDSETGGFRQGNPDWLVVRYMLTISNGTFTVTDTDTGTVVFQG